MIEAEIGHALEKIGSGSFGAVISSSKQERRLPVFSWGSSGNLKSAHQGVRIDAARKAATRPATTMHKKAQKPTRTNKERHEAAP